MQNTKYKSSIDIKIKMECSILVHCVAFSQVDKFLKLSIIARYWMPNLESPQLYYKKPSFPLDHVRGGPVLLDSPKQYLKRLTDGAKSQSDWHLMRWAVAIKVMRVGSSATHSFKRSYKISHHS